MRRFRRGATLIELLIASGALMVLLGLIYQMMVAAQRYKENCDSKVALQEEVMKALSSISRELVESNRYGVNADVANSGVIFSTPRGKDGRVLFDSTGRLLWRKTVLYYFNSAESKIMRKSVEISPAEVDVPAPPTVLSLRDNAGVDGHQVAKNIEKFKVEAQADGTFSIEVKGQLVLFRNKYGIEIASKVIPSN
jgi:hypothetical protein